MGPVDSAMNLVVACFRRQCSGLDCDIDIDAGLDCHECGHSMDCMVCCTVDDYYKIVRTERLMIVMGLAFSAYAVSAVHVGGSVWPIVLVAAYALYAAWRQSIRAWTNFVLILGTLIAVLGVAGNALRSLM